MKPINALEKALIVSTISVLILRGGFLSTLVQEGKHIPLNHPNELKNYFQQFSKSIDQRRIGLEAEFFGVEKKTGKALSYEGKIGIEACLRELAKIFHYQIIEEDEHIIALKKEKRMITLEPGGQVELSAEPVYYVSEVEEKLNIFLYELQQASEKLGEIAWLGIGFHPFCKVESMAMVPKKRYGIMSNYLSKQGRLATQMMKCTATNQFSFDYLNEKDALEMIRIALFASPVAAALFANSPITCNQPNGYVTYRSEIWKYTDPDRSGLIPQLMEPNKTFEDYLNYVLDIPLMFMVRGKEWIPLQKKITFRKFIESGYEGEKATVGDFELHLSAIFSDARFKQYVEIRSIDCQAPALIPAIAAFWKGLLYQCEFREAALKIFPSVKEMQQIHSEVPQKGLRIQTSKGPLLNLASELVEISREGLKSACNVHGGASEAHYLNVIEETLLKPGKSPSEHLLNELSGGKFKQPEDLVKRLNAI